MAKAKQKQHKKQSSHLCIQGERIAKIETAMDTVALATEKIVSLLQSNARIEEKVQHSHQIVANMEVRLLNTERKLNKQDWVPKVVLAIAALALTYFTGINIFNFVF